MQKSLFATLALLSLGTLSGCFGPDMGETPFLCGANLKCPEDYICQTYPPTEPSKWQCVKNLKLDFGAPDRKIISDSELLPKKEGLVFLDGALVLPAPSNCADYSSEPNNSGAKATDLTQFLPALGKSVLISGWEICYKGDVDQYSFKVESTRTLTIKVAFTDSKGDLDAALIQSDGTLVSASRGEKDNETVTVTNTGSSDGKYILGVWGFNFDTNTYDLDIEYK